MRRLAISIIVVILLITPIHAAQVQNGTQNFISGLLAGGLGLIVNAIWKAFSSALEWALSSLIKGLASFLAYVPRPAAIEPVRDIWRTCFNIYLSCLLPLSLVILGIYVMFSSEPPNRMFFEGYLKRIAYATLLAYFSFPIIDTLVWLTNQIAGVILDVFVRGGVNTAAASALLSSTILSALGAAAATGGVLAIFVLFFIVTAFAVIAIRIVLIYMVAATMPIFSFFLIIGVGPLRKLGEFVEMFWGLGIILPTISVLGAVIVGFLVQFAGLNIFQGYGIMSVFIVLGPLFLVFAFPFIIQSMMGMFSSAVGLLGEVVGHAAPFLRSAAGTKLMSAVAMGGRLAPLYALMPSKLATTVHRGLEWATGLMTKAPVFGRVATVAHRVIPELRRDQLALSGAGSLAKAGVSAASFGTLFHLARSGGADVSNPNAVDAFEDISIGIHKLASSAVEGGEGDMKALKSALSTVYGENFDRSGGIADAYQKMLKENFTAAKRMKDPGIGALAAMLAASAGGNVKRLRDLMLNHPELSKEILGSKFAKAFLGAHGISQRDLLAASAGDFKAAEKITSELSRFSARIRAYDNTFRALTSGAQRAEIADALIRDVRDIGSDEGLMQEAVKIFSEASGMPEYRVKSILDDIAKGNARGAIDLARYLETSRERAVKVLGENIVEDTLSADIVSDAEAARRIADFISSGGLVRTSVSPEEAESIRRAYMYIAQQKVAQMKLREYFGNRVLYYNKHFTRLDPYSYDPHTHTIDYRAALRGWSWVRGGERFPPT